MLNLEVEFVREFSGHRGATYTLFQGREANLFYSAGSDGLVVEWDLAEETGTAKAVAGVGSVIYAGCYLPVNREIVIGTKAGGLYSFNPEERVKTGSTHTEETVFAIARNNDFVTASAGRITKWIRQDHGFYIGRLMYPIEANARAIALSPDREWIASGWSDGRIRVFRNLPPEIIAGDFASFDPPHEFLAHEPSVFSVTYSAHGRYLFSGGRDAQIKVWDAKGYSLVKAIPAHWFTVNHLALSPDGKLLGSASRDKSIKIWDAETFDLLKVIDIKNFPQAHTYSVNRLLWTVYENCLISAGDDRKIKVWRVR